MSELYLDLFEKYTQNQLTEIEKIDFESKLIHDADFKKEFDAHKTLQAGIRLNAMNEKLAMIKKHAGDKITQSTKERKSKWWSYVLYFGFTLGILSLVYYVLNKEESISSETNQGISPELKNETPFKTDSLLKDTIESPSTKIKQTPTNTDNKKPFDKKIYANNDNKNQLAKALSLYASPDNLATILRDTPSKNDDYKEALTFFNRQKYLDALVILSSADDDKSNYLRAHCLLLSGQSQKAAEIFRLMANDDFSNYYEDAKWYLAIALYANFPDTKEELNRVIIELESNNQRKSEAIKLKALIK